jgi:hypothetical protein
MNILHLPFRTESQLVSLRHFSAQVELPSLRHIMLVMDGKSGLVCAAPRLPDSQILPDAALLPFRLAGKEL